MTLKEGQRAIVVDWYRVYLEINHVSYKQTRER